MRVHCAHDELIALEKLVPNPKNPNEHSEEQVNLLARIMEFQGVRNPIVVSNRSGFMTKGHGRLMAARRNGWTEFPVDFQDYDSEAQEYADMVADNKIAELSESNMSMIYRDAAEILGDVSVDMLGIPEFEFPEPDAQALCEEDEIPDEGAVETRVKLDEIWKLGRHRLMCGDSTRIENIEELMAGKKTDMVFTDPPYGMNLDTSRYKIWGEPSDLNGSIGSRKCQKHKSVIGDDKDFKPDILLETFQNIKEIYLWGADYFCQLLPKNGSWIVWDKTGGNESLDNVGFQSRFELCWSKSSHQRKILRSTWIGVAGMSHKDDVNRMHPTQKPVKLCESIIKEIECQNVVDLYGGSGSTLIACEKTNRTCYMMELDPHYCDVILSRWERYTGKTAKLISGELDHSGKGQENGGQRL